MAQASATTAETKVWGGGRSPFNVSYGKMMMWFFLLTDAFTFGAFLISYGTIRFATNAWPDPNHVFSSFPLIEGHLPLVFVSLMTFILIMSSVTMVLAVGAGSLMFSHVNDAGFWLYKEYFNLSIKDTIRSWSLMETIVAIAGITGVMILNQIIHPV